MNNCNICKYLKYEGTIKFCTLLENHKLKIEKTKVICYSFTKKGNTNNQPNLFT